MTWASLSDIFAMGGYGFYVWGSFLMFFICLIGEIILILNRKRTLLKQLSLIYKAARKEQDNETKA